LTIRANGQLGKSWFSAKQDTDTIMQYHPACPFPCYYQPKLNSNLYDIHCCRRQTAIASITINIFLIFGKLYFSYSRTDRNLKLTNSPPKCFVLYVICSDLSLCGLSSIWQEKLYTDCLIPCAECKYENYLSSREALISETHWCSFTPPAARCFVILVEYTSILFA
jgi:hypothetical protein